ncbi:MAG: M67 family metallopeptidase [Deltaproteobacteria bacterium]|jgi:proteasome lid subunit RPN8/RPN11|nr:M67 family metallopeptidase [Deltaproteobacteria bacterium]
MISLFRDAEALVRSEAEAAYPYECCGLVMGVLDGQDGDLRKGSALVVVANAREGDARRRRFSIGPEDFLRAEREAARLGLDVIGVYHSHPDHPAVPSEYDLSHALPFYSYVIVSVEGGRAGDMTSWRLAPDRSSFAPEPLEVDPGPARPES